MKTIITICMSLMVIQNTYADCEDFYLKRMNDLKQRMNPAISTMAVNSVAEVVVVSTLASAGTLAVASAIALPASIVGAAGYYGVLATMRNSYKKSYLTIRQAKLGEGKQWRKFVKKMHKKNRSADEETIRMAILRLNSENSFCPVNVSTGKMKLMKYGKLIKLTNRELY